MDENDKTVICDVLSSTASDNEKKLELLELVPQIFHKNVLMFHRNYSRSRPPTINRIGESDPKNGDASGSSSSQSKRSTGSQHRRFSNEVRARDKFCTFCWIQIDNLLHAAHIIAQKNVHMEQGVNSILWHSHLTGIFDVRNGFLLCQNCHTTFGSLRVYVSTDYMPWYIVFFDSKMSAIVSFSRTINESKQIRNNGHLNVEFGPDENIWPSKKAFEYHKAACLIWQMAGGADVFCDEEDFDDDYQPAVPAICDAGQYNLDDKITTYFESMQGINEEDMVALKPQAPPTSTTIPADETDIS